MPHGKPAGIPCVQLLPDMRCAIFGLALQGGFDVKLNDRWAFNVDVKYAQLASGVYAGAAKLTEARLDPVLHALGLRYEF